jgi:hypothetical protein
MSNIQQFPRQYSGKLKSITVVTVPIEKYPQFVRDKDHPCSSLSDEQRIEEIVSLCAAMLVEHYLGIEPQNNPVSTMKAA